MRQQSNSSSLTEISLAALCLVSLCALVDGALTKAYFQVDDFNWLRLAHWSSVAASFHGPWGHEIAYRPITRLSFFVDWLAFGWNAGAWHLENLFWQVLASLGIFVLLRCLRFGNSLSLLAAALFLLSPLGAENVDWISGRTGLLSFVFLILAMLSWIAGFRNWRAWIASACLYVIAMMSYEPAIIFPLLLASLIPCFHQRLGFALRPQLQRIALVVCVGVAFWLVRFHFIHSFGASVDPMYTALWPALRHNVPAVWKTIYGNWGIWGISLVLFALIVSVANKPSRWTAIGLGAMAVCSYLPFLLISGAAPRFLFLAQLPAFILVVLAAETLRGRRRQGFLMLVLALVVIFGRGSYRRASSTIRASNQAKLILDEVIRWKLASGGANIVVDGIPDQEFGASMLSFYFETAVQARLGGQPSSLVARSQTVQQSPALRNLVVSRPTVYLTYEKDTGQFHRARQESSTLANPVTPP